MGTSLELELSLIAHVGFRLSPPSSRRPNSSHSDQTLSSGDGSPVRKPRPHSIAGRLPSYMSSTASSEARLGRNRNVKLTGKIKQFTAATHPTTGLKFHSCKAFLQFNSSAPPPPVFFVICSEHNCWSPLNIYKSSLPPPPNQWKKEGTTNPHRF